jgi:hypothetical protein
VRNVDNEIILGHPISNEVKQLLSEVQAFFPNKSYHIGKLEDAEKELGVVQPKPDCDAVCQPAITEFIAIWIKTCLPDEEFNAVLAEELLHNKQAYLGFPEIVSLQPNRAEISYRGNEKSVYSFGCEIISIICDLDAHRQMATLKINLEPLVATDVRHCRDAIVEASSSEAKLTFLKAGSCHVTAFPHYLLWWYDVFELGLSRYVSVWQDEIKPWFDRVMPETMKIWDELTVYVHNNPVADAESANRVITVIFEKLLSGTPTLKPKKTSGISVPSLSKNFSSPYKHHPEQ